MAKLNLYDLRTTNRLLMVLAIPLVFYIIKELSFIFTPLIFSFFIALLFIPLLRWFHKKGLNKILALLTILLIIGSVMFASIMVIDLTGKEIISGKDELYYELDKKVGVLLEPYTEVLGIEKSSDQSTIKSILFSKQISEELLGNFGNTFLFLQRTVVGVLLTLFFLFLILGGTFNFQLIIDSSLFMRKTQSIKTYLAIEKSIVKFLKVKTVISLLTGIGFGLITWAFGISFPLFWGVMAFAINYVQMVGSVIATIAAILFAFIELESPGTVLFASLLYAGVQILFGSVAEPFFMGRSFSINVITVLVMLMFWGYLLGISGLILAVPITVFLKTLFSQWESTKMIAKIMS